MHMLTSDLNREKARFILNTGLFYEKYLFTLTVLILFIFTYFPASFSSAAQNIIVHDGDTFRIIIDGHNTKINIRLFGIDCPELDQPGGEEAKNAAESALRNATNIAVEPLYLDKYKRAVAIVYIDGVSLEEVLLSSGHAWVFGRYCNLPICEGWKQLEEEAKVFAVGLWNVKISIPPWEWRALKKHKK